MNKVLLVEDDPDLREGLATFIELQGWDVVEAENGRAALSELQHSERPDLIILDLMMPVMNGLEFLKALEDLDWRCEIPVALVTGLDEAENLDGARVAEVLTKPVEIDQLRTLLSRYRTTS